MSNTQPNPWATGEGFGTPSQERLEMPPREPWQPTLTTPTQSQFQEPVGISPTQQFGTPYYPVGNPYPPPVPVMTSQPYWSERPEHPDATAALILGLVGLVLCFLGVPVTAPFAWWLGARARRDLKANPGRYADSGRATTGMVMGIIGTTILALIGIVIVLGIGFLLALG